MISSGTHPVVPVLIRGETRMIDEQMAPMIEALNTAGIKTLSCCQETYQTVRRGVEARHEFPAKLRQGPFACITFHEIHHAIKFLELTQDLQKIGWVLIGTPFIVRKAGDEFCPSSVSFPSSQIEEVTATVLERTSAAPEKGRQAG